MTIRPARPDADRIRAALAVRPPRRVSVDEILVAIAALKRKREALGMLTEPPRVLTDAERGRLHSLLSDLAAGKS